MKTYFTGQFAVRRPVTVVVSLAMSTIGLCLAFIWLPEVRTITELSNLMGAIGSLLFILFFLSVGLFMLYHVLKNTKHTLSITSDGISYESKLYRWEDVLEIGTMRKYSKRRDLYCTTRSAPQVIELLLSSGLDSAQIEALFAALRREVLVLHPHIQITDKDDAP